MRYFELARNISREALRWPGIGELTANQRRKICSATTAANMLRPVKSDPLIAATSEQWDSDPMMLATPVGVVDLKVGKMLEASREQHCTRSTSVAPENGEPALWIECLRTWFQGDESLMRYAHLFAGYCATGDTREKMFAFMFGPQDTGKSTYANVLMDVLGTYAQAASIDTFLETKQDRHSAELAVLEGARLVVSPETEEGRRWSQAKINMLTGRDKVTARLMYGNPTSYVVQFKLLVYGKNAPHVKNVDGAFRRRLHILPFAHSIPREEQDPQIAEKLRAEYPKILQWIIDGCIQWQEAGLPMPEAMTVATDKYLDAEDSFGEWVESKLIRDPQASCTGADAYKSFREWAEGEGDTPMGRKRFAAQMQQRGFDPKRTKTARGFSGCRLRGIADG